MMISGNDFPKKYEQTSPAIHQGHDQSANLIISIKYKYLTPSSNHNRHCLKKSAKSITKHALDERGIL